MSLRYIDALVFAAWIAGGLGANGAPVHYAVIYKGETVATQTVTIAHADELTTVTSSFTAELPVFISRQQYSEELAATFRADGTVTEFRAARSDGPQRITVSGHGLTNDALSVVRTNSAGVTTHLIAREDYDFNSLAMYGAAPADFLPTNRPARLLDVAEGQIVDAHIQINTESDTFERQHLTTQHLIWTVGHWVSHSWHPERFSNLPRRYIRQTDDGEFTFQLLR